MNRGAGRRITMAAGSITTITGRGARAVTTTVIEAGGVRRWWLLFRSVVRTATTFAGTHCLIIIAIRTRLTTAYPIG